MRFSSSFSGRAGSPLRIAGSPLRIAASAVSKCCRWSCCCCCANLLLPLCCDWRRVRLVVAFRD